MTIRFYVNEQQLSLAPSQKEPWIVEGSTDYLKLRFYFVTSDWLKNTPLVAKFVHNEQIETAELGIDGLAHNECLVPSEMIAGPSFQCCLSCENFSSNYLTLPVITRKTSASTEDLDVAEILQSIEEIQEELGILAEQASDENITENIEKYIDSTEFIIAQEEEE